LDTGDLIGGAPERQAFEMPPMEQMPQEQMMPPLDQMQQMPPMEPQQ
jgi:hypothetical protein